MPSGENGETPEDPADDPLPMAEIDDPGEISPPRSPVPRPRTATGGKRFRRRSTRPANDGRDPVERAVLAGAMSTIPPGDGIRGCAESPVRGIAQSVFRNALGPLRFLRVERAMWAKKLGGK
jgi:hypothetical protein